MAKFVSKARSAAEMENVEERADVTSNYEGGLAFQMSPEMELYTRAASCLVNEAKFYGEKGETEDAIFLLIAQVAKRNPEFVLQLASHARNQLNLRSVPVMLLVEACKYPETRKFVRAYGLDVIQRADELCEVVAAYIARNGYIGAGKPGEKRQSGKMSNPLKRVLAKAFFKFSEYQFAKYDRDGDVKLRDVMMIAHPKPKSEEQAALFKRILERKLVVPDTWEVKSSATKGGMTGEQWNEIFPKMGFMAVLRNIRNMADAKADLSPIVKMMEDADQVRRSKQFPYRFLSAYLVLQNHDNPKIGKVRDALETAIDLSIDNVPEWPGTTFVATDNSGSMASTVSEKSMIPRHLIGNLLGAMAHKLSDEGIAGVFGETFAVAHISKANGTLNNAMVLAKTNVGHATNAWKSIEYLLKHKIKVDRICIFSDMQCYDTESFSHRSMRTSGIAFGSYGNSLAAQIQAYRKEINPNVWVYSFDLAGYGTAQFPEGDPHSAIFAGWSDKVLQFVPMFEQRKTALEHVLGIKPGQFQKVPKKKTAETEGEDPDAPAEG